MTDTLSSFILTDSIYSINLHPTFDYSERAVINRTRARAQSGRVSTYTILTDTVDLFTLPLEYLKVGDTIAINSWWATSENLWFTISPRSEIAVKIINIQKPFFQPMRNDLYAYQGILNLNTVI